MTTGQREPERVQIGRLRLAGRLALPEGARGVVVCLDESGSSLSDACHCAMVGALGGAGIATLLIDLLTTDERADACVAAQRRANIELLARRVLGATDWLCDEPRTEDLPVALFATGAGSAVALAAAADRPALISAVVTCRGRPLLARPALPQVRAPTLLIAFEADPALARLNRSGLSQMLCEKCLEIVPALPEQPEPEEPVARLARDWFARYLVPTH